MNQPFERSNIVKVNREIIEIQQLFDDIADIEQRQQNIKAQITQKMDKNNETLTNTNVINYMADALT